MGVYEEEGSPELPLRKLREKGTSGHSEKVVSVSQKERCHQKSNAQGPSSWPPASRTGRCLLFKSSALEQTNTLTNRMSYHRSCPTATTSKSHPTRSKVEPHPTMHWGRSWFSGDRGWDTQPPRTWAMTSLSAPVIPASLALALSNLLQLLGNVQNRRTQKRLTSPLSHHVKTIFFQTRWAPCCRKNFKACAWFSQAQYIYFYRGFQWVYNRKDWGNVQQDSFKVKAINTMGTSGGSA